MLPWRRSIRPIYPGVLRVFVYGLILWALALLGIRLPIELPRWLFLLLELLVVWQLWKGWKLARRAPGNHVRLFNAQDAWATAFTLQALVVFLW
jgi:hypothetical protein